MSDFIANSPFEKIKCVQLKTLTFLFTFRKPQDPYNATAFLESVYIMNAQDILQKVESRFLLSSAFQTN
jgi:hypothetical protein